MSYLCVTVSLCVLLTTISIVSSNSSLIISTRTSLEMYPSLSASPPRATKASRYSSTSPSLSLVSYWSLYHLIAAMSILTSTLAKFLVSMNSFMRASTSSSSLYPQAVLNKGGKSAPEERMPNQVISEWWWTLSGKNKFWMSQTRFKDILVAPADSHSRSFSPFNHCK